jgi:hypothetical protein
METLKRVFIARLGDDAMMLRVGQWVVYGFSLGVMLLGLRKVTMLNLSEADLFFGVLLVVNLSMLMAIGGMLLPLTAPKKAP